MIPLREDLIIGFVVILTLISPPISAEPMVLETFVTDEAGVLLSYEKFDIEEISLIVKDNTGAEMVVVIVDTTLPEGIDTFAVETFDKSNIGEKDKDNGLLLIVSVREKAWRVEVGYGLEGFLTDGRIGRIAREYLVPALNISEYYVGIYNTMRELGIIIENEYDWEHTEDDSPWYPIPFIPFNWWQLTIALIVMISIFILTKGRLFLWIGGVLGGGRGGFGGGRSGGGGAKGRY